MLFESLICVLPSSSPQLTKYVLVVRFQDDLETEESAASRNGNFMIFTTTKRGKEMLKSIPKNTEICSRNKPFQNKKLSRVFSEDYEIVQKKILDPRGPFLSQWNKCFLISCLISLFVDPLFLLAEC